MGLLKRLAEEVQRQPEALASLSSSGLPTLPSGSILVGAGDSYAAALAAFYLSKGKCLVYDPYYLATSPETASGREVVFISASGRTSSNIIAASRVKKIAARTTALTIDAGSRLASVTDRMVKLPMTTEPRMPGALSFSMSLLALLRMTGNRGKCDFRRAFAKAEMDSRAVGFGSGTTYFLGNSAAHAISLYAAAKVYELLGKKAQGEALEEFSHLELFSLGKRDAVNIYSSFDGDAKGRKLKDALSRAGYKASLIGSAGPGDLEQVFHDAFVGQLSVLAKAEATGLSDPSFLKGKKRLGVSDTMIY